MKCARVRRKLMAGVADAGDRRHLAGCPDCGHFAERLARAAQALDAHHTAVAPDPGFAARVVASLSPPTPMLGWAALRTLPIATALALVLSAWALLATGSPTDLVASGPTDDVVSWALGNGGGAE